jgi:thioredoxin reductase
MAALEQQAVRFATRIQTDDGQNPDVSNPDDGHSYKYHDCKRVDLSSRPFKIIGEDDKVSEAHAVIIATGATANWLGLENEMRLAAVAEGSVPARCAMVPCRSFAARSWRWSAEAIQLSKRLLT